MMLALILADGNSLVELTKDSLEIVFKVPVQCCSEAPSSSSLGDAGIAAIVLGVLVAVAILATFFVVLTFCRKKKRK